MPELIMTELQVHILVTYETKNGLQLSDTTFLIHRTSEIRRKVEEHLREVMHDEPCSTKVLSISHTFVP